MKLNRCLNAYRLGSPLMRLLSIILVMSLPSTICAAADATETSPGRSVDGEPVPDDVETDAVERPSIRVRSRWIVEGLAGAHWLTQESHATPLCCGERDSWRTTGFEVGIRGARQFGRWFRLGMEGFYGFGRAESNDDITLNVHHFGGALIPDLILRLPVRSGLSFKLGLVFAVGRLMATNTRDAQFLIASGIHKGFEYLSCSGWSIGGDVQLLKYFIVQHSVRMSLAVGRHF